MRLALAFVLVLGAACGPGARPAAPVAAPKPAPARPRPAAPVSESGVLAGVTAELDRYRAPAACERRADEMSRRLGSALLQASHLPGKRTSALVPDHDGRPYGPAVEVVFFPTGEATIDGRLQHTAVPAAVRRQLATRGLRAIAVTLPGPFPLTPLLPALRELSAVGDLNLVVDRPGVSQLGVPSPDAPPWIARLLAYLQSDVAIDDRSTALVEAFRLAIGTCAAGRALLSRVRPEDRSAMMEMPRAVRQCGCVGIDVDAIENLTLMFALAPAREPGWLRVVLRDDGSVVHVAHDQLDELARALAAVPAETRRAGVAIEQP